MATINEVFGYRKTDQLSVDTAFIAGLECEIESVRKKQSVGLFIATDDGSLRNHGVEFISAPLTKDPLLTEFKNLHASLTYFSKDEAFSPRTSTHVHINCRPLTEDKVKNIVLLYALFEEFFFCMVEPSRRGNIHCVPLTETFLCNYYNLRLQHMLQRWHKYTALNIIPLGKLGTIEFRHMQGTDDSNLMESWLTALENLWHLGQEVQLTPDTLGNNDTIKQWFMRIFRHSNKIMALEPCLNEMVGNSLIDVKLSLV